jgi:hypothetical protein
MDGGMDWRDGSKGWIKEMNWRDGQRIGQRDGQRKGWRDVVLLDSFYFCKKQNFCIFIENPFSKAKFLYFRQKSIFATRKIIFCIFVGHFH